MQTRFKLAGDKWDIDGYQLRYVGMINLQSDMAGVLREAGAGYIEWHCFSLE